jgi:hypothetical protein
MVTLTTPLLPGNSAQGDIKVPLKDRRGTKEETMEQVNHLSLNLAGDPVLDPPEEVVLLDPHMKMATAISKIKDAVDEKLAHTERLVITGRLGLLPAFIEARGYLADEIDCNSELFGAIVTSPYGLACPLPAFRQTAMAD